LIAAALLSAQTSTNTPATLINNSMVVIPGTAPKIVQKAISLGPAPPNKEITVMILPKPKMDELHKYIQELYTPGSPNYGKFLTSQQVYAKFGYGI
jgi:subtilase family serine protease